MKKFLQILLMPIARFCLRNGISLTECIDALKTALLNAGVEHLEQEKEAITASRLSIMSGVHRKDSALFLKGVEPQHDNVPLLIKILGLWHSKKKFLDSKGKPRRLTVGREDSEFADLVREVSGDLHSYTFLKELERLQLVELKSDGVIPLKSSYISSVKDDGTAKIISRDLNDLLLSAEENINAKGRRPNHHTTTEYDNIPKEYLPELREWIIKEAGEFHKKVRQHVSNFDRDLTDKKLKDSGKGRIRFSFCSFARTSVLNKGEHEK